MNNPFTKGDLCFLVEAMDRKARIHNTMMKQLATYQQSLADLPKNA